MTSPCVPSEPLPCPFCGAVAIRMDDSPTWVRCSTMMHMLWMGENDWNERRSPAPSEPLQMGPCHCGTKAQHGAVDGGIYCCKCFEQRFGVCSHTINSDAPKMNEPATERAEALEEAAKVADDFQRRWHHGHEAACHAGAEIASGIRSLASRARGAE